MAEAPTYSLAQIIALAKGTTNWYEYAKSGAQHGKNNQDAISTLQSAAFSGATPGWQAAIDLRWYVADTSSSTTTYTGVTKPTATGSDSLFAGYRIRFKPANNNTGASTLNVASSDGAVDIKKITSGAKAALAAGDLDSDTYAELIFDGTDWLLMNAPAAGIPTGVITMWSGAISAIPTGWVICDGTNSTPDLTDRFVIHADADSGGTNDVGDTGGSHTATPLGSVGTSGAHTLSTSEMPSHTHTHTYYNVLACGSGGGIGWSGTTTVSTGSTGGGGSHTHTGGTFTGSSTTVTPKFYALAYIMKT
ncbi:MAG: hypothetical protein QGE95_14435 [Arenicellales bacterium]|jgi:hypothetical protein|nr:hypothetical protein [Arenicellales bacterium]